MRLLILTILSLTLIAAQTKELKRNETEAKALADSLYVKLISGADFTSLAKLYSEDPGTKEKGGKYEPFKEGTFNIEFENVVVNLKLKEICRPFKSPYGYHIAQLLEINGDYYTVRHILIKFQNS
jgi:parvulin-like peptidyl-prolyl isomerase